MKMVEISEEDFNELQYVIESALDFDLSNNPELEEDLFKVSRILSWYKRCK